jgi:hypothetical protein
MIDLNYQNFEKKLKRGEPMNRQNRNNTANLTVRPAQRGDVKQIWDILHSESRTWSLEQIVENLFRLWVLTKNERIIGVFCESLHTGQRKPDWVAIHPLYPEQPLNKLMIHAIDITYSLEKVTQFLPCPRFTEIFER